MSIVSPEAFNIKVNAILLVLNSLNSFEMFSQLSTDGNVQLTVRYH